MTDSGNPVISVRNVSKSYWLYDRPQDRLKQALLWRFGRIYGREFWALRDISFDIYKGEAIGIIGRNGAGKSTLLQIIAGILQPTTGSVETKGRVASLLELGSGFNSEYTGRENVYMNAAILGISVEEVQERFDEIAAFADIGEFMDQPVKTYSSGIFLRLAFAVFVSLCFDVFIIDEAMSVGDVFFRQKCYTRMRALVERGASVLFVSHDMVEIEHFCSRAMLLERGRLFFDGLPQENIQRYYSINAKVNIAFSNADFSTIATDPVVVQSSQAVSVGDHLATCASISVQNEWGMQQEFFEIGQLAVFCVEFELLSDIDVPICGLGFVNDKNILIHGKNTLQMDIDVPTMLKRGSRLRFQRTVPIIFRSGDYTFRVGLAAMGTDDYQLRYQLPYAMIPKLLTQSATWEQAGKFSVRLGARNDRHELPFHGMVDMVGNAKLWVENKK